MTTTTHIPMAIRESSPEAGPLTDGGYRWVGTAWGIDLDARGRAIAIVMWPVGLSGEAYRRGARAAVRRAEAAGAPEED